jgi:predicted aconitase
LELSSEERAMLEGAQGEGVRKAMEIVVALGKIYGAEDLVPVAHVQVSGVSYKNLDEAGLEFLQEWAEQGARVRVPTTLNPAGMDLTAWREMGIPEQFARRQLAVIGAFARMGVTPLCSCTPYLAGYAPELGQHIAWGESSAVSYANSLLGARTNREGGPGALAAAITGRTARYGLHLESNRLARFLVEIRCPVKSISDYGALGYMVGRRVRNGVPYFHGLQPTGNDQLKALGAAMAASGAVALYHVEGVTPEAASRNTLAGQYELVIVESLEEGYRGLDGRQEEIDLVWLGCPHASLEELEMLARALDGRRARTALWITTSRPVREQAQARNLVARIAAGGGRVITDTCMIVAPVEALGFHSMATNSGKGAFYGPGHARMNVRYGSLEQCVEAALSGRWPGGETIPGTGN